MPGPASRWQSAAIALSLLPGILVVSCSARPPPSVASFSHHEQGCSAAAAEREGPCEVSQIAEDVAVTTVAIPVAGVAALCTAPGMPGVIGAGCLGLWAIAAAGYGVVKLVEAGADLAQGSPPDAP